MVDPPDLDEEKIDDFEETNKIVGLGYTIQRLRTATIAGWRFRRNRMQYRSDASLGLIWKLKESTATFGTYLYKIWFEFSDAGNARWKSFWCAIEHWLRVRETLQCIFLKA